MSSSVIRFPSLAEIRRANPVEAAVIARQLARIYNECDALFGVLAAKVETEGVKVVYQYLNTALWLDDVTQIGPAAAKRIVIRGKAVNSSSTLGGTEIPAIAPLAGAAARAGEITPAHVDEIVNTMIKMPATVSARDRAGAEKILVDLARQATPLEVRKAGDRLLNTFDPDGPEPKDPPERPQRELAFQEHRDGSATLKGKLDNLAYAQLRAALDPLAKPHSTKEEGRDTRSQWERQADALVDLVRLAMTVKKIPTHGGDRVHVAVTVDYETLKSGIGVAMLDFGGVITAAEARMLACDCKIIPAVLGSDSEPMDLGRSKRFITPGQRCRLVMRDRGCAFPGCNKHAKHTEGHHIVFWANGGQTNFENLTLLCERHHRLVHCGGREVRMGGDGRPDFIPPAYLDPLRRPRRNTCHV
ncbi:HNH endonuclease signature motif containing protein [Amycolatopsis sp.]|uniref:HNH endonuclease signature motif containing protein n=1 Tax=Amycolatopsis sp. TaxID=37632 RepID=UPI0026102ECF|nr:HNH endonuclease signature motif containing protein [Amycolatopsis sp.]